MAPSSLSKCPLSTHCVPATVTGTEHIAEGKAETLPALAELTLKVGKTDREQPSAAGMPVVSAVKEKTVRYNAVPWRAPT